MKHFLAIFILCFHIAGISAPQPGDLYKYQYSLHFTWPQTGVDTLYADPRMRSDSILLGEDSLFFYSGASVYTQAYRINGSRLEFIYDTMRTDTFPVIIYLDPAYMTVQGDHIIKHGWQQDTAWVDHYYEISTSKNFIPSGTLFYQCFQGFDSSFSVYSGQTNYPGLDSTASGHGFSIMDVSPDGERILAKEFYDTQYPNFGNSVILLNSRFKDQTMIIDNSKTYWDFAHSQGRFSPDGKTIAAVCAGSLYLYYPDNPGSPVLIDTGVIGKPEFSPNSNALAYLVNGWPAALRILDFTSHHKRDIYDNAGGFHLAWSPDNRAIAFFNWQDSDFVEVAEIEVETSHLTSIISSDSIFAPDPGFFNNPFNYSPDGKALVFSMLPHYWYPHFYFNLFSLVYNRTTSQIDTLKGFILHQYLPTGFHALGTVGSCPAIYNFVTRHIDTLYSFCQKINNDYVWAISIDKIFFRPESIGNLIVIDTYDHRRDKQSLVHVFPNPFNPSTKIHYQANEKETGILKIYAITGKLVLSRPVIGNGIFEWNARGLSSGIYILQVQTGNEQFSRKLILEK